MTPAPRGRRTDTLHGLVERNTERTPEAVALAAPGRRPLTYRRLSALMRSAVNTLRANGVRRNDRIAIVLGTGAELASVFIATATAATSAPLNPAYRERELQSYLRDLDPRGMILESGVDSVARDVARARGITVFELVSHVDGAAGEFVLTGPCDIGMDDDPLEVARPEDVALMLHTGGTTSGPKLVPLTHANLACAAENMRVALQLTERDRCLNVMPLFHLHGLSILYSSFAAGASVACPPRFHAPEFFAWMDELSPTWYSAAPAIHQAVVARAGENGAIIERRPLRLIRSAAAALQPALMADLERTFQAPVIESYGMTETSAQITSNPLPPGRRKSGSAGLPAGPDVAVIDEAGRHLGPGDVGEIVLRGPTVMAGYDHDPAANETAFINGWLRSGDQGFLDEDGYLFITGRLKELINRGGQKISPRELDDVVIEHPAVAEAVSFAIPDRRLGQDIAVAVVLKEHRVVTERDIQDFVATRLARFKIPRRVVFLDQIPKTETRKVQRGRLAERLGFPEHRGGYPA